MAAAYSAQMHELMQQQQMQHLQQDRGQQQQMQLYHHGGMDSLQAGGDQYAYQYGAPAAPLLTVAPHDVFYGGGAGSAGDAGLHLSATADGGLAFADYQHHHHHHHADNESSLGAASSASADASAHDGFLNYGTVRPCTGFAAWPQSEGRLGDWVQRERVTTKRR